MTIQELNTILKTKKWLFEISISGRPLFGKHSLSEVENLSGTLDEYLKRIAKNNNADTIGITLFAPNGSSNIRKDFFLLQMPPVVASTKIVAQSTKTVEPPTKVVEPSTKNVDRPTQTVESKPLNKMDNIRAEIENVKLSTELSFLKQRNAELEERTKKAELKQDELYSENLKLNRHVNEESSKLHLEHEKKLIELERDKKGGLSGIMDEAKNMPPEMWQFLAGLLPNHPMGKMLAPANTPTNENLGTKHSNADAQSCIDLVNSLLVNHDAESVGKLTLLIESFVKNNDALNAAYASAFPN